MYEEGCVMATAIHTPKTKRLNFRISNAQGELLRRGANVTGKSVTEFIVESACLVAECELAVQNVFKLPPGQWKEFLAALDKPTAPNVALHRLLTEPSVVNLATRNHE